MFLNLKMMSVNLIYTFVQIF